MEKGGFVGCLLVLVIIAFILLIGFGFTCLVAKGILWVSLGLFNYDLSTKFWYIVALLYITNFVFGTKVIKVKD